MPGELIATDPIVTQNFYLETKDFSTLLTSVSGLDMEYDVVTIQQVGALGRAQSIKTRGNVQKVSDLSLARMAPLDAVNDPIWKWFNDVRNKGFAGADRSGNRKDGSIVLYDTSLMEIGRFNFYKAWPSKIATDSLDTNSSEALKETITLVIERLERVK